jgi:hypothetical protein
MRSRKNIVATPVVLASRPLVVLRFAIPARKARGALRTFDKAQVIAVSLI